MFVCLGSVRPSFPGKTSHHLFMCRLAGVASTEINCSDIRQLALWSECVRVRLLVGKYFHYGYSSLLSLMTRSIVALCLDMLVHTRWTNIV